MSGTVTDLRYLSVDGKATLISGTDSAPSTKIDISAIPGLRAAPPQLARAAGRRVASARRPHPGPYHRRERHLAPQRR